MIWTIVSAKKCEKLADSFQISKINIQYADKFIIIDAIKNLSTDSDSSGKILLDNYIISYQIKSAFSLLMPAKVAQSANMHRAPPFFPSITFDWWNMPHIGTSKICAISSISCPALKCSGLKWNLAG